MVNRDLLPLVPHKGFYYHYKRLPGQSVNKHAYEVLNLCIHMESDELLIAYRPLYGDEENCALRHIYNVRPISMFMENVEKKGEFVPRFERITDPETIKELVEIRNYLYPAVPE